MERYLLTVNENSLDQISADAKQGVLNSLEAGKVIYMPAYSFEVLPDEAMIFSEVLLDQKHKNLSYDMNKQVLSGYDPQQYHSSMNHCLSGVMHRFAEFSQALINQVLPSYQAQIKIGRTSYRPIEIRGRVTSKRKDDTRLHVDSFASTPVNGERILRVFCNINPYGEPRVWHLGELVSDLVPKFNERIRNFSMIQAKLLKTIKATKSLRSAYDHYMLNLHDHMKMDDDYQQNVSKLRVDFPSNSTWIVFTDQVSHAALGGQFLLEQTFYLPLDAMHNSAHSPYHCWSQVRNLVA